MIEPKTLDFLFSKEIESENAWITYNFPWVNVYIMANQYVFSTPYKSEKDALNGADRNWDENNYKKRAKWLGIFNPIELQFKPMGETT